ncbi:MAG: exodeoxyribonuclease VII large subunit [Candidatus Eiseniibacteriota bacterium]
MSLLPGTPSRSAEQVYTVTELTGRIKRLLEQQWAALWVEGEVSNVRPSGAGHVYFTLKDEKASLDVVLFRTQAQRQKFRLEHGQKVRVFGSLNVYAQKGAYQINAAKIEPVGVGELELAFRQLHARLAREGLFDPARKRPIPRMPRTVGIVTSSTGAAIRDLISVLRRRAPQVRVVLRPARVQGEGAAVDVARAVRELDEWGEADVLIVGRGGGSLEDLWTFNEEIVARAIHASRTPVISAVGHEIDQTIADFVADVRAPTPSAAAELAAPDREALLAGVTETGRRLAAGVTRWLRARGDRVKLRGEAAVRSGLARLLERSRLRLAGLGGRLDALSPLAILGRGYAIASSESGRILRAAGDAQPGERIEVRLARGRLGCRVEEVGS